YISISHNTLSLHDALPISTSSSTQNGTGRILKIENNKAIAVSALSPPESKPKCCNFFPGGWAIISIPVSNILFGSVNFNFACPRSEEHTSELQSRFDLVCR